MIQQWAYGSDLNQKTLDIIAKGDIILDPRKFGVSNTGIFQWRQFLKLVLLQRRMWKSDVSNRRLLSCEMHEGLIPRRMVPKSIQWHYMIFHEYNCFLLSPEEHRPQAPSREWCFNKAYKLFGRDNVVTWVDSLPWKVPIKCP